MYEVGLLRHTLIVLFYFVLCAAARSCLIMSAENVSQNQNKRISYDELLRTIKSELKNRVKELIPQLCYPLANEVHRLRKEDIRDRTKQESITEVNIPVNDLMKVLINRAIKSKEPYIKCSVENGIVQLPEVKNQLA